MKQTVYFEEANAGEYLAQIINIAKDDAEAEYEVVMRDGDRLIDTDMGVMLVREKRQYVQKTYMTSFTGVAFVEYTSDPDRDVITLKMIKME